ncbi:MAG: hypothetical protein ACPGTS_02290 [Minisyncoccia bacterium]
MKAAEKRRKICDSWYHQWWFRVILVIVGIDMIVLGFGFVIGIDIMSLTPHIPVALRIVFGAMYILVALFVVHYALAYEKIKKESHFVCQHCAHPAAQETDKEDKE